MYKRPSHAHSVVIAVIILLITASIIMLPSCSLRNSNGELLEGQKLFSIGIGALEDEIDIFHRGNILPDQKNRVFMYQGLIFVANSLGGKIMEFSSYGDLISLKYNENENPRPVLLSPLQNGEKIVNKTAVSYPFYDIGEIAVSSDHVLLVEDHVPPERQLIDQESGAVLQHIIHRFGPDGQHLDYIGQEGIGGTPFPFIYSLDVTANDDIVVVTSTGDARVVYWYNSEGDILFTVKLDEAHLPAGTNSKSSPSLISVRPDMNQYRLYLHLNYYGDKGDRVESMIYQLELPEGRYSKYFKLPDNIQSLPGVEGMEDIQYLYDFIGSAEGGYLYFLSRNNAQEQTLLIMNSDGDLIAKRIIRLNNPDIFLTDFQVSREGIITGLLGDPEGVDIYWWRPDELIH